MRIDLDTNLNELGKDYLKKQSQKHCYMKPQKNGVLMLKAEMYKLPPMYVGPYAEQDADLDT